MAEEKSSTESCDVKSHSSSTSLVLVAATATAAAAAAGIGTIGYHNYVPNCVCDKDSLTERGNLWQ